MMKEKVISFLHERSVEIQDIAEVVLWLQQPYYAALSLEECIEAVQEVLDKREVQFAILTGIALDILAEKQLIPEPIGKIICKDEPLYGIDEVLASGITSIYGTIGLTSFGYLDKVKYGIIGKLDSSETRVNTFIDDLVAAVAAASAAKIAHRKAQI